MSSPIWHFVNGVPTYGGSISITGTQTSGDFVATNSNGGLFIASNAVQFRRNSSTADAEIYAGGVLGIAVAATNQVTVCAATATPASGSTAARLVFGTTAGFGIYYGSGAPTVSAAQGSLYLRSDGSSTSTRAYVNNSSGSGTTWTAITTAA